jgi:molybdate-binding protein
MYEKLDLSKVEARCRLLLNSPYLRRQVPEELKNLRGVLENVGLLVKEDIPSLLSEIKQLRNIIKKLEEEAQTNKV